MASVTNPMKCVLNINFRNAGWSELYILQETDYAPALVKAVQIALYRTAFFGTGVQLVFAHVSRIGAERDSVTCDLNYPLGPHPSILPDNVAPNDTVSAVQERFETAGGRCHIAQRKIMAGEPWECDHVIALADWTGEGHGNRESNLAPALTDKHRSKTSAENTARADVRRVKSKHIGIKTPKRKIPARVNPWGYR